MNSELTDKTVTTETTQHSGTYDLGIVIPTYNEKDNIHQLLESINVEVLQHQLLISILIIDDNSPDNTGDIIKEIIKNKTYPQLNIQLFERESKLGLASAYKQGFCRLYDQCEFVMSMDADLSHNPKYIKEMLELAKKGNNCVIGSRYIKGGSVEGWGPSRLLISRLGSLYAQILLFSSIRDQTGGFNIYSVESLTRLNIETIKAEGYMFQIEMKFRFKKNKHRIVEYPIVFTDRVRGKSKISRKIIIEAFLRVPLLRLGL